MIAQRRHLTILFSDLVGSTAISAGLDPEHYAALLERLRETLESLISARGGAIVRIDGDGFACIFGYPTLGEGAGREAIEAALDIHAAAAAIGAETALPTGQVRLHTGIHSGVVLVREGDSVRGRFEMIGDATNIAARLCDLAQGGEILVSEATLGGDLGLFRTGSPREVRLKGREAPLTVFAVQDRIDGSSRFAARKTLGLTRFCGRSEDLAQLAKYLDAAKRGMGGRVFIVGPAGIGKSRIVDEFLNRLGASQVSIHRGSCAARSRAKPLEPVWQIASSLAENGAPTELSTKLDSEHLAPGEAAQVLRQLIAALPADQTPILAVDDWHWIDDASRQVFDALVSNCPGVLLVLTSRADDLGHVVYADDATICLQPLGLADAGDAIRALLPAVEPGLVERIWRDSGGSPLFIEELCHAFDGRHRSPLRAERMEWLAELVQARYDRLAEPLAKIVRIAAVIGTTVPCWLLERIAGGTIADELLAQLVKADFLFPGEQEATLRFKHVLTRDAVYQTVGLAERRALHAAAAAALESGDGENPAQPLPEAMAYHCAASGDRLRAAVFAEQAGDAALASAALDRAQEHYRSCLELLTDRADPNPNEATIGRVARKYGQASVVDPSQEQVAVLQSACDHARHSGCDADIAWAEYWLGFILYGLGESRRATVHLRAAVDAADVTHDKPLRSTAMATFAQALAASCDYDRALPILGETISERRSFRRPGRPAVVLAYTLACRAFVRGDQGHFIEAYHDLDEAMEVLAGFEHESTASILAIRCAVCIWQGRFEEARELARDSRSIAERIRARYLYVNGRSLDAFPGWCLTGDNDLLDEIETATNWLVRTGREQFSSLNHGWLAHGRAAQGRWRDARRHAARAFVRARKGDRLGEAMAARAMAMIALHGHARKPAAEYLALAERSARSRGSAHEFAQNQLCAAELGLMPDIALDHLGKRFEAMGMSRYAARAKALEPAQGGGGG
jgi:class 3 adenylate cyclase/tetratricopeptide (TPR) repeat protein